MSDLLLITLYFNSSLLLFKRFINAINHHYYNYYLTELTSLFFWPPCGADQSAFWDCWCGFLLPYNLLLLQWCGACLWSWLEQKFASAILSLSQWKREDASILWLQQVGYVDITGILPERWFATLVFMPMDLSSESEEDATVAASDNLRVLNSSLVTFICSFSYLPLCRLAWSAFWVV